MDTNACIWATAVVGAICAVALLFGEPPKPKPVEQVDNTPAATIYNWDERQRVRGEIRDYLAHCRAMKTC